MIKNRTPIESRSTQSVNFNLFFHHFSKRLYTRLLESLIVYYHDAEKLRIKMKIAEYKLIASGSRKQGENC